MTNVRRGGGLISYCLIQIYTLLLGCQPKSWRTVFSGPKGELAILNPQSNTEQLIEFLLSDLTATLEQQLKPVWGEKSVERGTVQDWFQPLH